MPTMARLVAAICLLLVGAAATQSIALNLPDPLPAKYLFPVNLLVSAVVGWITIGKRLGRGVIPSLNWGLTAGVGLVFWALLAHAVGRMWILAFRESYKTPPDAILGVFEEFMKYAVYLQDFSVIGILVMGSALAGVIAEFVNRRFP